MVLTSSVQVLQIGHKGALREGVKQEVILIANVVDARRSHPVFIQFVADFEVHHKKA
jgi:hypothetical protein